MIHIPPENAQGDFKEVVYTEDVKGRTVNLRLRSVVKEIPEFDKVTSVAVIPFVNKDEIITTQLKRGVDLPGGHTEPFDKDIVATVARESAEEAAIELDPSLYVIGIISSDYAGPDPKDVTYMLITAGKVTKINDFVAEFESSGRAQLTLDQFLEQYRAGSHEMMAEVVGRAKDLRDEIFSR